MNRNVVEWERTSVLDEDFVRDSNAAIGLKDSVADRLLCHTKLTLHTQASERIRLDLLVARSEISA